MAQGTRKSLGGSGKKRKNPWKFLAFFVFMPLMSVHADPLNDALLRNELCADSGVTQLVFAGIEGVENSKNFCRVPTTELPKLVRETLVTVDRVHHGIAEVLGTTIERAFGLGFTIEVRANDAGPLISHASGGGMLVGAFADWQPTEFPAMVYAHELVHVLTFNGGFFSTPIAGLRHHPFLIEALPDLIAASVNGSPVLDLGDTTLPNCVNHLRDETPPKGLGLPMNRFYSFASRDQMSICCQSLTSAEMNSRTSRICANYLMNNAVPKLFPNGELTAPFAPEKCFTERKGITRFENCDTHQFGFPLTSFFFALEAAIGRKVVPQFVQEIARQSDLARRYTCKYLRPSNANPKPVKLRVRNVLPLFTALRESLGESERTAFDTTWKSHAMEKMAELDRIYAVHAPEIEATRELAEKNPGFAVGNRCMNGLSADARACQTVCTALAP